MEAATFVAQFSAKKWANFAYTLILIYGEQILANRYFMAANLEIEGQTLGDFPKCQTSKRLKRGNNLW